MGLFDRFRRGRRGDRARRGPSAESLAELRDFMRTRDGVEAYVEPPTAVYAMSLCLVAADGEFRRLPVKDERQARSLCAEHGVPMYDARLVGYPRRMREYERGVRRGGVSLDDLPPLEVVDDPDAVPPGDRVDDPSRSGPDGPDGRGSGGHDRGRRDAPDRDA